MERVSEPAVKSERGNSVWANTEYEGKGTHSTENPPENVNCIEDSLHIKDEPEEIFGCIKKEIKDEVEVGLEEWGESETGDRYYLSGCGEGILTEVGHISSTCMGMPEVFQKIKVEMLDDVAFKDLALETGLDVPEGETIKPEEEEWCQVESSHTSSVELKYERIFRKKFGCVKNPVVRLERLNPDTTVPLHWINSERKLEHINKETQMMDPMAKNLPQGPTMAQDSGSHLNNKGGSTEIKESFCERDICDQLSAKTFDGSNLDQHSPVNSKVLQCTYNPCVRVASNTDDLNVSTVTQNKEKKFECDQCSYKTNGRGHFTRHCLNHSNIKKFVCDHCAYKTNDRSHFNHHYLIHSNIKKFACEQCPYKTNCKKSLARHCLNHGNMKKYACDQCSYKTNDKGSLTVHCLNHCNIRKFVCDKCAYKTNDKSHFTRHCLNHSNIKKLVCDQCAYKTNNKNHLARHCLNHSKVKKFDCDQCSYKTNNKGYFTQHCRNHSKT